MEFKGTKGEWCYTHNSWQTSSIYDKDKTFVASVNINYNVTEYTQDKYEAIKESNAKLIAAAPDLLEALKSLIEETEDYSHYCPTEQHYLDLARYNARLAIEKALK